MQHDLVKATSLPLAAQERKTGEALVQATAEVTAHVEARQAHRSNPHSGVKPASGFENRLMQLQVVRDSAQENLNQAQQRRAQTKEAIAAIGEVYHPFVTDSGAARLPEQLRQELEEHFQQIERVAEEARLSESSRKRIAKARRVMSSMVATLAFFWCRLAAVLGALHLDVELESVVREILVPAYYLARIARQAGTAQRRGQLSQKACELFAMARAPDGLLMRLPSEVRTRIEQVARDCADLFQRSSSCTEGRNGQLRLRHHGLHRLSGRKLAVLTAIHNYFIRHPDGTTAAERFFGLPHESLFEYLVTHLPLPSRPAQRRSRVA